MFTLSGFPQEYIEVNSLYWCQNKVNELTFIIGLALQENFCDLKKSDS